MDCYEGETLPLHFFNLTWPTPKESSHPIFIIYSFLSFKIFARIWRLLLEMEYRMAKKNDFERKRNSKVTGKRFQLLFIYKENT
jgi:hypothetical protein